METQLGLRNLIDLFNTSLSQVRSTDKACLEIIRQDRVEKLTFDQLRIKARNFASWLVQTAGIGIQDKVAILGKNRADWDVALWGTIFAGATPVLIDPERGVEGVINHLRHTDTRILVMADDYQDSACRQELTEFARSQGLGAVIMTDTPLTSELESDTRLLDGIYPQVKPDDTAVILCTSGTTGDPREVELTHANLIANVQGSVEKVRITEKDVLFHILPPHHSFGLTVGKLLPLSVGATNVYTNKYRDVSDLIRDKHVTIFVAIPALFATMAKRIEESLSKQKQQSTLLRLLDRFAPRLVGKMMVRKNAWTALRFCLSGAAPMPKWVLNVFWKRGLLLYEGYGTTENSPVYGFNDKREKLGSVGKPITTLSVKIVDENDNTLEPGQRGEICLGGPCIMKGYYKNPQSTRAAVNTDSRGIRWLHTGDLGYLDEDGDLYITGRKKYVIVLRGGKNVNPELVESVLSQAHYVKEVLVVPGIETDPAGIRQECVRALVQPAWDVIQNHANLSHSELVNQPHLLKSLIWQNINECQQKSRQLAHFERVSPAHLEIQIEEFQKTSTGKIKREMYIRL